MATDEEYLDSLLKSMTENEQQSRNMEDVMKSMNVEVEDKDAFSFSQDDLADMLDMIEEKEEIQPVIEEIQDEGTAAVLGSVDMPVFQAEDVETQTVSSGNEMADDDFIRNLIAQQEALEAESSKEPLAEAEILENDMAELFQQTEVLNDASQLELEDNVVSEGVNVDSDENQEDWKFDLEALLQASDEEIENTDNEDAVDFADVLSGKTKEWDEVEEVASKENYENMDVTELIDNLDEAQNDLLEINDLLKKADSNEYVETDNEDMLALLGSMQEEAAEENFFWENAQPESEQTDEGDLKQDINSKGKKKKRQGNAGKKGLFSKKNKETKDTDPQNSVEETADVFGEEKKEKKPGRLAQFFTYITQEAEEPIDENAEILNELEREDAQKAKDKKKEKKSKKKKPDNAEKDKDKAAKKAAKAEKQQEKRQKKEEKRQEKLKNKPAEKPGKLLSKKGKIVLIAFCASLVAAIFSLNTFIPDYVDKTHAREAFFVGDYEEVYKLLYGKKLSAGDRLIFDRVTTVLSLQRKLSSYQNNKELEREVEALDALLLGVEKYHELENVDEIGVRSEVDELYNQICGILLNNYGLSQENVLEILGYDEFEYTRAIYNLIEGKGFSETEEENVQQEPKAPQDILPEEEEIINLNNL